MIWLELLITTVVGMVFSIAGAVMVMDGWRNGSILMILSGVLLMIGSLIGPGDGDP